MDIDPPRDSIRLAPGPTAARTARRWVLAACEGLTEEQRHVAELLTSELVSNAIRHPVRDERGHEIEIMLQLRRTEELLGVAVHDHDPTPLPPVRAPRTPRESGMGLHLVDELASAWGSCPAASGEGKVVWFELRLRAAG